MNLEALAVDVIRPALQQANLAWHCWHAFRRGLATNLDRRGVSDKLIQQILRHANVSTTMNIYVKTVSADLANEMKRVLSSYWHPSGAYACRTRCQVGQRVVFAEANRNSCHWMSLLRLRGRPVRISC